MAHYKRRSRTPRVNMDPDERMRPPVEHAPSAMKKKSTAHYCKVLHGEHNYALESRFDWSYTTGRAEGQVYHKHILFTFRCEGCGKKKWTEER